jgi:large subunit ribosomal protein L9
MDIILLQKVENLGNLGDRVKVKAGYGRNFLIPLGKAAPATAANLKAFEERRVELERIANEELARATARQSEFAALGDIKMSAKAGAEGKLFGSLGTVDVAEAIERQGVKVERKELRMPHGPIRAIGEHEIEVHLHTDVNVKIKVVVTGED